MESRQIFWTENFQAIQRSFATKSNCTVGVGVGGVGAEEGKDMIQFVFFRKPPQIIVKVRLEKIQLVGKDPREEFF